MALVINLDIIIPSRGRAYIAEETHKRLPSAVWVVPESQADQYKSTGVNVVVCPDDVDGHNGISKKRQWILDNLGGPKKSIVMIDDDLDFVRMNVGKKTRKTKDPDEIRAILESTALVSKEAGSYAFGFGMTANPLYFWPHFPFIFASPMCGVIGQHHNDIRFDSNIKSREDFDYSLQIFLKKRFIWIDNRFFFYFGKMFQNRGGLQSIRTRDGDDADLAYLKKKWGAHMSTEPRQKQRKTKHGNISLRITRTTTRS